jgi:hypothetical protein
MHVQSFFLAERITLDGSRHDVRGAGIARLEYSPEVVFPLRFSLPFLLLLRRESASSDAPIRLRLSLVDEDGRPAGKPKRLLVEGVFPAGKKYYYVTSNLELEFPRPGGYCLDLTADERVDGKVYHYNIDVAAPGQI